MSGESETDAEQRRSEQLKKRRVEQPGPAKNVGDDTPNPLPEDPDQHGGAGGDAGRN